MRWLNVFDVKTPGLMKMVATTIGSLMVDHEDRTFANTIEPILQRRLARTTNRYLGLVPSDAQVGDMIVDLRGGR